MAEKHSLGCAEEENENDNVSGLYITENWAGGSSGEIQVTITLILPQQTATLTVSGFLLYGPMTIILKAA